MGGQAGLAEEIHAKSDEEGQNEDQMDTEDGDDGVSAILRSVISGKAKPKGKKGRQAQEVALEDNNDDFVPLVPSAAVDREESIPKKHKRKQKK